MNARRPTCSAPAMLASMISLGVCLGATWSARGSAVQLRWISPDGCPAETDVRERLAQLLGGKPSHEDVEARVLVEQSEGLFRAEVVIRSDDRTGVRQIEGASCEEVSRAAALIVALAVNPMLSIESAEQELRSLDASVPSSSSTASSPPPVLAPRPAAIMPMPVEKHRGGSAGAPTHGLMDLAEANERTWEAKGALGMDVGTLPAVAPWAGVGVRRWYGRLGGEVMLNGAMSQRGHPAQRPEAGGDVGTVWASGAACMRTAIGLNLEAGTCLGPSVHVGYGQGVSVATPKSGMTAWPSAVLAGHSSVELGAMRIGLEATGVVPVLRPRFYLDRIGTVHRPAPAFRLSLTLACEF